MVFSSITFLFCILPLFLITSFVARRLKAAAGRNAVLLLVSLLFYTWGEAVNVLLLIALGFFNYGGGLLLSKTPWPRLTVSLLVACNLAVLAWFKYVVWLLSFFVPQGWSNPVLPTALPLGISFFTFHAVSYLIDVHRKDIVPARSSLNFLTYFCMFPHLVAGPIVRYRHIQNELSHLDNDPNLFSFGMYRFLLGFNKKILLANMVAPIVDNAFIWQIEDGIGHLPISCADAWLGAVAYTLQIYFDFSAYSDMAIGLAAMAGFRFAENFQRPYSASSIREFWRRWHISLSSWFRDYLYLPLGGNRQGQTRTLLNLLVVFTLCGLWHGANLTFLVWGLWHGMFLVFERLGWGKLLQRLPSWLGRLYTILIVLLGWVFFQSKNLERAVAYLKTMFMPWTAEGGIALTYFGAGITAIAIGIFLCLLPDRLLPTPDSAHPEQVHRWHMLVQALLFFPALAFLVSGSRNPFIYFNF